MVNRAFMVLLWNYITIHLTVIAILWDFKRVAEVSGVNFNSGIGIVLWLLLLAVRLVLGWFWLAIGLVLSHRTGNLAWKRAWHTPTICNWLVHMFVFSPTYHLEENSVFTSFNRKEREMAKQPVVKTKFAVSWLLFLARSSGDDGASEGFDPCDSRSNVMQTGEIRKCNITVCVASTETRLA